MFNVVRPWAHLLAWLIAGVVFGLPSFAQNRAYAKKDASDPETGFVDPRLRQLPRRHRFRLGVQVDYIRLSSAVNENTGNTQRFHYVPLQPDFAYQLQFLRRLMLRPSLAFGVNLGNTMEAMPVSIHPQIHTGYQGSVLGIAFGYGFFEPLVKRKDVRSDTRGGEGQPVITNNHHVGVEVSATTRIHSGALSFQFRIAGVTTRTQHFMLDERRWRYMLMFNFGWYFGDGRKARQRRRERKQKARESAFQPRSGPLAPRSPAGPEPPGRRGRA